MNTDIGLEHAPSPRNANSESSWFFKSGWASTYFRDAPEGQVFTCPSPWMFGRRREYRLGDAQAEELVARISRAFATANYVMTGGIVAIAMGLSFFAAGPVVAGVAIAVATVVLVGVWFGIVCRAAGSVLVGVPWTSAPREPYSLTGNLKKNNVIIMLFPTWVLAGGAGVALVSVAVIAVAPFVSGKTELNVSDLVTQIALSFIFGRALVTKLRAQRIAR
jgi:hypothetical protein